MTQLIIFDWDHTLAVPESGETFRKRDEKYKWIADPERLHSSRKELLEHLYYSGSQIAIATNQGGIAFGIVTLEGTEHAIFALLKELDFPVPFLVSPYHPDRPASYKEFLYWRKPNSGMYTALHALFPDVADEDVVVVGDRDEDEQAAKLAGFAFERADVFFLEVEHDLEAFISAEQNAGEVFEEEDNAPPF